MIQDRSFNADGSLLYPPARNGTHPAWMQEFFGNAICVNGKAAPFLEVEPRKYRFRMVNGSNSRFYHLTLVPADASGKPNGKPRGCPAVHSDRQRWRPAARAVAHALPDLLPGERFDIVIDFSGIAARASH
jgi:spore coat protein A